MKAELEEKKILKILNKATSFITTNSVFVDPEQQAFEIAKLFEPYIKLVEEQDKFLSRLKLEFYEKCGESFAHKDWFKSFLKEIAELKKEIEK